MSPITFGEGTKAEQAWRKSGDNDEFPPIEWLLAKQEEFSGKFIDIFVKGRDDREFGPVLGVFGLTGTGKSALWALLWNILAKASRFKLCLYKCSQGLYDALRKKWAQYECPADWQDRVYRAMNIAEIKPDSFVVCDEGLLGMHALTALRTEMRKFGGFLGEVRQKGCPVYIGAQTETIVAEVRRHMRLVLYKSIAVLASRREIKDPVELHYLSWLKYNEGKEHTLVDAGYRDLRGKGVLHITAADLKVIPWFDQELSTYMRNENADVEAAWRKEILVNIINIADNFFTDCKEAGATPNRLLKCKAGWLRSYYQRYDSDFLEYLGPNVVTLADQITFVAKRLVWQRDDAKLAQPQVQAVDIAAVQKDSFRDFVQDYLRSAGASYFAQRGVPPEQEWLITAEFADGATQRQIEIDTGIPLVKVNAVCQYYWAKFKRKKEDAEYAPPELQVWKLYELWDCSRTGGKNGGGTGEVDNYLPDGRAGTCKCYFENLPTLTFSLVNDFGPEIRWAADHEQDTIRVAIRNIFWINNHPQHVDWVVDAFPVKQDAEGHVVDDKVVLHPEKGFLRPDGTPIPFERGLRGEMACEAKPAPPPPGAAS